MLTFFAIVFLLVFIGILFGAVVVELQKRHYARAHASAAWHSPHRHQRTH